LIRDGEVVWSSAFGVRDRREPQTPLTLNDRFRVRAPMHVLALLAGQQQQELGHTQLAKLLQQGAELDEAACRASARDGRGHGDRRTDSRAANVGMDLPLGAGSRTPPNPQRLYGKNTTFGFLRLSVEMASGESFSAYCAKQIFSPLNMIDTAFTAPAADDSKVHVAFGHSRLGSPMQPHPASDESAPGGSVFTTADDLAILVKTLMAPGSQHASSAEPVAVEQPKIINNPTSMLDLVAQVDGTYPSGLGLALEVRNTPSGSLAQVDDVASGTGCLLRWYPAMRCGVVVLYNSATGQEAAQRIAHVALGGE
jgi:CubicO group peptidase (beta-lactamase class C family)